MHNPYDLLPPDLRADFHRASEYAWEKWDRWLFAMTRWKFSDEAPKVTGTIQFGDGGLVTATGETCLQVTQALAAKTGNFSDGFHSNPTHH